MRTKENEKYEFQSRIIIAYDRETENGDFVPPPEDRAQNFSGPVAAAD